MRIITFCFYLALLILCSCDNGYDKSLITEIEKLSSPKRTFTLYKYVVESEMAFGSGFTAVNITDSNKKCDYTNRDIFRLGNNLPFYIKWKNENSLLVKCLLDGGELSDKQPVKKEIRKWKNWIFEVEYYTMYSASSDEKLNIDSYSINQNLIVFKSKKKQLIFKKDEVQFSLDSNKIHVKQFKTEEYNSRFGLSFSNFEVNMENKYDKNDFIKLQAFERTKIK